jgi:hypothetical protein
MAVTPMDSRIKVGVKVWNHDRRCEMQVLGFDKEDPEVLLLDDGGKWHYYWLEPIGGR